jgi:hypothetical protein
LNTGLPELAPEKLAERRARFGLIDTPNDGKKRGIMESTLDEVAKMKKFN